LDERRETQTKVEAAFCHLEILDVFSVTRKTSSVSENQALILLSSKLTFSGVQRLEMALDHVPSTYSVTPKRTSVPLHFLLVCDILQKEGVDVSPNEVQQYTLPSIQQQLDLVKVCGILLDKENISTTGLLLLQYVCVCHAVLLSQCTTIHQKPS